MSILNGERFLNYQFYTLLNRWTRLAVSTWMTLGTSWIPYDAMNIEYEGSTSYVVVGIPIA